MKIVVRAKAADDLVAIYAWIAKADVSAAQKVVWRIRESIDNLTVPGLAHIGRPGRGFGTRELIVSPYIIVYEVQEHLKEIVVLAIFHGAQNR